MAEKHIFVSERSPIRTFFLMFVMRHSFYLGRTFRGFIQWFLILLMIGIIVLDTNKEGKASNEIVMPVAVSIFYLLFFWFCFDMYLLFSGKLKDVSGRTISLKTGCPNCGYTDFTQETKVLKEQTVKIKTEQLSKKHYNMKGQIVGYTKDLVEENRKRRDIETCFECPQCNHTWKQVGTETSRY